MARGTVPGNGWYWNGEYIGDPSLLGSFRTWVVYTELHGFMLDGHRIGVEKEMALPENWWFV